MIRKARNENFFNLNSIDEPDISSKESIDDMLSFLDDELYAG